MSDLNRVTKTARPTLKDVADLSGYALRTVKKVMSGDPHVRDRTKAAVLAAAEELQYTRNKAASALAKNRSVKLAVVFSEITEAYFPEIRCGFQQARRELQDFGLVLEYHVATVKGWNMQEDLLDTICSRKDIDGVLIQPYDATALNPAINRLVAAGKPVVTFGADAPDSKRLCYVGPDAYKSGRIGGQILANYIGKSGKVFLISQSLGHMQTIERQRGFLDRIHEFYPEIQVFEVNLPDNSTLYYEMVHSIVSNESVDGMFCTDANTVVAGKVLKDLGRTDIALVGFDLSESGIHLMKEGYIKVIIEQKPEVFARQATLLLFRHIAENKHPEMINNTPLYILTSECLDE
jgi:LacI family transcriptional regulator